MEIASPELDEEDVVWIATVATSPTTRSNRPGFVYSGVQQSVKTEGVVANAESSEHEEEMQQEVGEEVNWAITPIIPFSPSVTSSPSCPAASPIRKQRRAHPAASTPCRSKWRRKRWDLVCTRTYISARFRSH